MTSSSDQITTVGADGGSDRNYIPMEQINPGFRATDDVVLDEYDDEFYWNNPGLARNRHSSARLYRKASRRDSTLSTNLLSMLPSRSMACNKADDVEDSDGAGIQSDSKKFRTIRESRLRRKKSLHNALYRQASMELEVADGVVNDLMSSSNENTPDSCVSALREMPTSLSNKLSIRERLTTLERKKMKKPSWSKRTKYALSMTLHRLRSKIVAVRYSLGFWQGHLKTVEGHFGTGVASYFIFLRLLFLLNLPLCILSFCFIVLPQLLYRFLQKMPAGYTENKEFTGVELLTGGGWLEDTVMFYGYYINSTINIFDASTPGVGYNMQYAYLLTCAAFYLMALIILAHSTAKSYRENYVDSSGSIQEHFIVKILNSWNFTTMDQNAASFRQKFIYKEMREYLSTKKIEKRHKTSGEWCRLILIRIIANIVVLGIIASSGFLIWYLYDNQSLKTDLKIMREMAIPLCISAFNIVMPAAFSMIGSIENYGKPIVTLYLALIRTMLLKGVILGVLIYFWFVNLNCHQKDDSQIALSTDADRPCITCWETFMGQEIYRLVLVDFMAYILTVILLELCRRLLADYCCKFLQKPEFDIGRNTLDLIFSQALCWLGVFYSPIISLIQLVKLFILFYVKKMSLMYNCAPAKKPWRAARTNTVFLVFLFIAFLMMAIAVAMNIIVIRPSSSCGPFRGLNSTYDIIIILVDDWRTKYSVLSSIITFFTSEGAVSGLIITLICFVYYLRIMAKGREELVELLLHQVRLEGRDKSYLLRKYQEIQNKPATVQRDLRPKPATKITYEIDKPVNNHCHN